MRERALWLVVVVVVVVVAAAAAAAAFWTVVCLVRAARGCNVSAGSVGQVGRSLSNKSRPRMYLIQQ